MAETFGSTPWDNLEEAICRCSPKDCVIEFVTTSTNIISAKDFGDDGESLRMMEHVDLERLLGLTNILDT